ncbi:MAG: hypothetical protein ACRD82_19555 [Blastocatellia bacterium]
METISAYEEVINFIAAGPSTESVATFKASPEASARVADLVFREKTVGLSDEEASELNSCMALEHLMRLAKIRARQHLKSRQST